ncbi:MAG: tRNA uracil 4-sulfurtransferase ThiI [Spongiibacteraceae bacterium]|nr:tRNA uracil 4-sulfurtransferase ThiI [Spongiibacteraceae bacterium]
MTIKSKPVRRQLVRRLRSNIRHLLKPLDPELIIRSDWDKLVIESHGADRDDVVDMLSRVPGIAHFLDVEEHPLTDLDDAYRHARALWGERLAGKRFAVRCKRSGSHPYSSQDVERHIGAGLLRDCNTGGVDLSNPELTVRIELRDDRLFLVNNSYPGLGGYPLGGLDPVLSLISGGFDSTVASYLTMRRGMRTHFVFFNLGGRDHEIGVKEVALYLWQRFGASSRVQFVAVPFEGVVAEILRQVDDRFMGVVLKRMMLRAASRVAEQLGVGALVTGEAVAQVSSQTLTNLAVIDRACDTLVLRPLITSDKRDIIDIARRIGTEAFAASMPEYCGVISVKPATAARLERVQHEETRFDDAVLEAALAAARYLNIDEVADDTLAPDTEVEILPAPIQGGVVIDVRHPSEAERRPLRLGAVSVQHIPFYELHSRFAELDAGTTYLLYCEKGVMSRLHASHLVDQGHRNVKVYRPG